MSDVTVRRLTFRGDPACAALVDAAVGNALRTEVPDDGRLVLIRRMWVGNAAHGGRGLASRTALAWRELAAGARHGGDGGAAGADCVWFASAAQARALLLGELARGRMPHGWFWSLAVPGWHGQQMSAWLTERIDAALHDDGGGGAILALIEDCLDAGCPDQAAHALEAALGPPPQGIAEPAGLAPRVAQAERRSGPPRDSGDPAPDPPTNLIHRLALRTARTVPSSFSAALRQVAPDRRAQRLVDVLAAALAKRDHPALTLRGEALAELASHIATVLTRGAAALEVPGPVSAATARSAEVVHNPIVRIAPVTDRPAPRFDHRKPPAAPQPETAPPGPTQPARRQSELDPGIELHSAHAGLLLAIIPLIGLGWREWLAARPGFLPFQPGPRLIRHFADRHRVASADPLRRLFPLPDETAPAELDQALELWRKGLDGWLRRRARRRLADLAGRSGWLIETGDALVVRFRLDAIDLRLRRLALDRDPGWVDWLGRSFRLLFQDAPLMGGLRP